MKAAVFYGAGDIRIEEREIPKCPYFSKCGGCDILHFKYKNSNPIINTNIPLKFLRIQ